MGRRQQSGATPPEQALGRIVSTKNSYMSTYLALSPYGILYGLIMSLQSSPRQLPAILIKRLIGLKGDGQRDTADRLLFQGPGRR